MSGNKIIVQQESPRVVDSPSKPPEDKVITTYKQKVPLNTKIYRRMQIQNPNKKQKVLNIFSNDESVLQIRTPQVTVPGRGTEYIRIKILGGENKNYTSIIRIFVVNTVGNELEETLEFHIQAVRPERFKERISKE